MRNEPEDLYLDLIKRCLVNWIYGDSEYRLSAASGLRGRMVRSLARRQIYIMRPYRFDPEARRIGTDWPPTAHSMIGLARLSNLQDCVETVLREQVPGDLIETGVWRGGACILMRAVLKAYRVTDRKVWVCDSFAGLPPPDPVKYPKDAGSDHYKLPQLAVSEEQVRANFERYGLLDEQVQFVKGWFKDTLPSLPAQQFAVIRLDGDLYESTMDAISALYPRLAPGGFLIIDDYNDTGWGCKDAIQDYRKANGIDEEIIPVDWTGAYWRRRF